MGGGPTKAAKKRALDASIKRYEKYYEALTAATEKFDSVGCGICTLMDESCYDDCTGCPLDRYMIETRDKFGRAGAKSEICGEAYRSMQELRFTLALRVRDILAGLKEIRKKLG